MRVILAVVGIVLAVTGIALSVYLKWTHVDMTPLRLFLTYPILSLTATFSMSIGGVLLKVAGR